MSKNVNHKETVTIRPAQESDLEFLVEMLGDDKLGSQREDLSQPMNQAYTSAFAEIDTDPNNELVVAELEGQVVGMLQLTFIPYLTYVGSWRCLIEGVRVHKDFRGQNLGAKLFEWAIERASNKGCRIVQLTSDKKRPEAIRFYERLGFKATHEGLKLMT